MFGNVFKNKKVLVTGNTGFKGSWLSLWLIKLQANVIGFSKDIPTNPSLFESLNLEKKITHHFGDLNQLDLMEEIIFENKPDFIFHLAAQPIVSESFKNPLETISSNTLGTANLLKVISNINWKCSSIIITSDKCYENIEKKEGYKESDKLGGKDIYSSSKAAAEILISSFFRTFIKDKKNLSLAIGRAGNVIGGGDWAKDRLIVDSVIAWSKEKPVAIRNPNATRPWQHVLEPLSGYLHLAKSINQSRDLNGHAFNFGPLSNENKAVHHIIENLSKKFKVNNKFEISKESEFPEASLLQLDISKANELLDWYPVLNFEQMIDFVSDWYFSYFQDDGNLLDLTLEQIECYEHRAISKNLLWAKV